MKQEAPLPRRAQRVRRAQLVYYMTFIARQTTDQQLINHLYETGHETYRIPRNNARIVAITTFKVVQGYQFWYQSKYDFLLVINSNWPSILHRLKVTADYMQNFG